MQRSENFVARRIGQDTRRNTIADTIGFTPDIALDRFTLERAVRVNKKSLILLNRTTRMRRDRTRPRAGRKEGISRLTDNRLAVGRFEPRPSNENRNARPAAAGAPARKTSYAHRSSALCL